jgi:hypothetical protein
MYHEIIFLELIDKLTTLLEVFNIYMQKMKSFKFNKHNIGGDNFFFFFEIPILKEKRIAF